MWFQLAGQGIKVGKGRQYTPYRHSVGSYRLLSRYDPIIPRNVPCGPGQSLLCRLFFTGRRPVSYRIWWRGQSNKCWRPVCYLYPACDHAQSVACFTFPAKKPSSRWPTLRSWKLFQITSVVSVTMTEGNLCRGLRGIKCLP